MSETGLHASGASGPRSILVIDDEEDVRTLISELLELAGYRVRTATDGRDGLRVFHEMKPDLVVLCSEDAAYLEFAKALHVSVPVVVAGNPVDVLEDLKAAGVVDFIERCYGGVNRFKAAFHDNNTEPLVPGQARGGNQSCHPSADDTNRSGQLNVVRGDLI